MNLIIILLGMLIFAGLHTLTASRTFKTMIRERLGDRVYHGFYRLAYNIVTLIILAPIAVTVWFGGTVIWRLPADAVGFETLFLVIQAIGLLGTAVALLQIDLGRFIGITQVWAYVTGKELPLPSEKLQRSGLYRFVRHPLYLFSLLTMWPVTAMTDTLLLFNIAATAYFIIGSRWEETRMVQAYGADYINYQEQVPWLIPFVKFL